MSSIGPPDYNYSAFNEMAKKLRDLGFDVVNPAELHPADPDVPWNFYLRRDIPELVKCDTLVLLRGWEISKGARLEHHIASELDFDIVLWNELEGWLSDQVG